MIAEIHRADWTIHFPTHFDEGGIPTVFQPLTRVEHEWDAFPWHLARGLVGLLEKPQSSFDYYQVTAFFRARAAMLALRGDVLYQKNWHAALVRHQVQVGGIYREHLLYFLRAFLKKHNFGELPECEVDALDLFRDSARTEANRDLIQGILRWVESNCVNTFNFISLAVELGEKVCGHTVGHWVKGADKPPPEDVHVLIRRHETGHDVLPSETDAKEAIRAGRNVTKSVVRVRGEAAEGRRPQTTDNRQQTSEKGQKPEVNDPTGASPQTPHHGPQTEKCLGWKVVGDFRVIMVPGHRHAINLATKPKTRAFLRFLCERLARSGSTEFYVEEVREAFNAQFAGNLKNRRWASDRFREDLFRGKEQEFDLLFEPLDRAAGHYRVRPVIGKP